MKLMNFFISAAIPVFIGVSCYAKDAVCIFDLTPIGMEFSESQIFTELLSSSFVQSGKYTVVERKQLNAVIEEQKLQMTGLTDDKDAVKIGKIFNAQFIITGSVIKNNNKYTMVIKFISVETAEIISSITSDPFSISQTKQSIDDIVYKINNYVFIKEEKEKSMVDLNKQFYTDMLHFDVFESMGYNIYTGARQDYIPNHFLANIGLKLFFERFNLLIYMSFIPQIVRPPRDITINNKVFTSENGLMGIGTPYFLLGYTVIESRLINVTPFIGFCMQSINYSQEGDNTTNSRYESHLPNVNMPAAIVRVEYNFNNYLKFGDFAKLVAFCDIGMNMGFENNSVTKFYNNPAFFINFGIAIRAAAIRHIDVEN